MRYTPKRKTRPIWNRWFAWHPVYIDKQWVWLEHVERRVDVICDEVFHYYRQPGGSVE